MLQHEQTDPQNISPTVPLPVPNAAEARVTPDELNAALQALEDRQSSTVAIGSVVDELRLHATPEQIWAEVQCQREQKQAPKPAAVATKSAVTRRARRGWRDLKGWAWILFWCSGGLGLISGGLHMVHSPAASDQVIMINGNQGIQTYNAGGKDVIINANAMTIYLHDRPSRVTVDGSNNTVIVDSADNIDIAGSENTINWIGGPSPNLNDNGHDNQIGTYYKAKN